MPPDAPPAVIRLLDSSGKRVLDSVASDYEDSFCLESFGDLIAAHRAVAPAGSRQLIIARVQTWDVRNPEREYFSYYNAFHLNRILFQTQIYLSKRLIHRMHVLNPLTNTDIIGNVLYFAVSAPPSLAPPSPSVAAADAGIPQSWAMASQAVAQLNGEKASENAPSLIEAMRRFSSNVARRVSAATSRQGELLPRAQPPASSSKAMLRLRLPHGAPVAGPLSAPAELSCSSTDAVLAPSANATSVSYERVPEFLPPGASKIPEKPLLLNESRKNLCVPAPPGIVTRFNVPLSSAAMPASLQSAPAAPGTPPSRRRDLSFRNHAERTDFHQWLKMLPRSSPSARQNAAREAHIDAVLIATDMDYLENAAVRARFRANALSQEDSKHFELPEYTGAEPSGPSREANGHGFEPLVLMRDASADDGSCCVPSEAELARMARPLRIFHRIKFPLLVIIVTMALLLFLLLALSSDTRSSSAQMRSRSTPSATATKARRESAF